MFDMIECPKCKRNIKYGKKSCFYCGESLDGIKPKTVCKKCKAENPPVNKFCMECGETLLDGKDFVPVLSRIPAPDASMDIDALSVRSITFTEEGMELEKGCPPQITDLSWNSITEVNVYFINDELRSTLKGENPAAQIASTMVHGHGIGAAPPKEISVTVKQIREIYICEIVRDNGKDFLRGDKFNFAKTLGGEREFSIPNNFTKLIKKILSKCSDIKTNEGVSLLLSRTVNNAVWE